MSSIMFRFILNLVIASLLWCSPVLAAQEQTSQFESYNYPKIKWNAKPVGGMPGAIVQLTTTYDATARASYSYTLGAVKYKVTLFKATKAAYLTIQLLDRDGFKLDSFHVGVGASEFQPVPGTQIFEARDCFSATENSYRQACDYTVSSN